MKGVQCTCNLEITQSGYRDKDKIIRNVLKGVPRSIYRSVRNN